MTAYAKGPVELGPARAGPAPGSWPGGRSLKSDANCLISMLFSFSSCFRPCSAMSGGGGGAIDDRRWLIPSQRRPKMTKQTGLALILFLFTPVLAAQPLVDGAWLDQRLGTSGIVVLDIRNRIDKGSRAVYAQGHIPGAVHSDYIKAGWRAKIRGVPGMLPPTDRLERLIGSLGISNESHVVVVPAGVSAADYGSAARVYWTFKVLGHDRVSVLDGGHAAWVAEGRPVETGIVEPEPATFAADLQPRLLASREDVRAALSDGTIRLVDNRAQAQFVGKAKHKKVERAGAIPHALRSQDRPTRPARTPGRAVARGRARRARAHHLLQHRPLRLAGLVRLARAAGKRGYPPV
jgi:3-mercaptopyruvate sulfurtransferase SseA